MSLASDLKKKEEQVTYSEIEQEILSALQRLALPEGAVVECDPKVAIRIVRQAQAVFVQGNPRSWWLSLRQPFEIFDSSKSDVFRIITQHIPSDNLRCWFIPETEQETLPVYDMDKHFIGLLLNECRFFEYYLVANDFSWLIVENDHNQVIVSRVPDNHP